jgi:hypothetical protein
VSYKAEQATQIREPLTSSEDSPTLQTDAAPPTPAPRSGGISSASARSRCASSNRSWSVARASGLTAAEPNCPKDFCRVGDGADLLVREKIPRPENEPSRGHAQGPFFPVIFRRLRSRRHHRAISDDSARFCGTLRPWLGVDSTPPQEPGRLPDLDSLLANVDTPDGRELATAEIARHGTPIYGTDPAHPGLVLQKLTDGTTRLGKFVNRQFVPADDTAHT